MLPPYGGGVHAPNFTRLAERCVTFDNCYVGSMPCIPARRELHTGRYNFLHRSWGPLEPFDDLMPALLGRAASIPTRRPITSTTSRMAARPITAATTPGNSRAR